MQKIMVIFGAGQGLSLSVAHYYGQKGYQIALVARREEKLKTLAAKLQAAQISASVFTADLTQQDQIHRVIEEITHHFGTIDAFYYAPNPQDQFTPAHELQPKDLNAKIQLYLYGLMYVVQDILPLFRQQQSGLILSAVGGTAVNGYAFMSGLGPIMAAARNYLQSLQQELLSEQIKVGLITISAQIQQSESYVAQHETTTDTTDNAAFPVVHPDTLARLLDQAAQDDSRLEAFYPEQA